jgi:DUF971 family protein
VSEPVAAARTPVAITDHRTSGVLEIAWDDGRSSRLPHGLLRARCRCAACQQQYRALGDHPPASALVRLAAIRPVGDQGLNLVFDDGHGRGIYPWSYLLELDAACAARA